MDIEERSLLVAVEALELPPSAYEKAVQRYKSLGEWFSRPESTVAKNDPHIFVQGSFALGTAIRPLLAGESYDLDLSCKLREGVYPQTHSQSDLKELVGIELEGYREAKRIQEALEEKNRCWRLYYQDGFSFHMDVVPGVPVEEGRRQELAITMESYGVKQVLAQDVSNLAVYITDRRRPDYEDVNAGWMISNPDGYCKWFESKSEPVYEKGLVTLEAQVDEVPFYQRKTNLQRAIQLLKRHRDVMYRDNPDSKPISIIITTLAAQAYRPGGSLKDAVASCLAGLSAFVARDSDTVPNPVNPKENFADRWKMPEGEKDRLKEHFHIWVRQALEDFRKIRDLDGQRLVEHIEDCFETPTSTAALGLASAPAQVAAPAIVVSQPPRPWGSNG